MLKPLVEEVGAPWAGFHAFRHTFASIHLSQGTNLVALSRAMGHHSAAFTLSRYTHLLPGDCAPPLDLGAELEVEEPLVVPDVSEPGILETYTGRAPSVSERRCTLSERTN